MVRLKIKALKTGDIVRCKIEGDTIKRAIAHVSKAEKCVWFCQNEHEGDEPPNFHGMSFGWKVDYEDISSDGFSGCGVSDIYPLASAKDGKDAGIGITYEKNGVSFSKDFIDDESVTDYKERLEGIKQEIINMTEVLFNYEACAKRGWFIEPNK